MCDSVVLWRVLLNSGLLLGDLLNSGCPRVSYSTLALQPGVIIIRGHGGTGKHPPQTAVQHIQLSIMCSSLQCVRLCTVEDS